MHDGLAYNFGSYVLTPVVLGGIVWVILRRIHAKQGSEVSAASRGRDLRSAALVALAVVILSLIRLAASDGESTPTSSPLPVPSAPSKLASPTTAQAAVCSDVQTAYDRAHTKDDAGARATFAKMVVDARASGDATMELAGRETAAAQSAANTPAFTQAINKIVARCEELGVQFKRGA